MNRSSKRRAADRDHRRRFRRRAAVAALAVLVAAAGGLYFRARPGAETLPAAARPAAEDLLAEARQAIRAGDYTLAERSGVAAAERGAHLPTALLIAAEAAARSERPADALRHLGRVPEDGTPEAVHAAFLAAELHAGRLEASSAESWYRRALAQDPEFFEARDRLAELLVLTGREWEAREHLFALVRQRRASLDQLARLGNPAGFLCRPEQIEEFLRAAPGDAGPSIAKARHAFDGHRLDEAEALLRRAVAAAPAMIEPHVWLGRIVVEGDDAEAYRAWQRGLPERADGHPGVWRVRARWAAAHGEAKSGIRCYWEAIRRDPNDTLAHLELARLLAAEGADERASAFARRGEDLMGFEAAVGRVGGGERDLDYPREAARRAEALGRIWEAAAWQAFVLQREPRDAEAPGALARLERALGDDPPQTSSASNLALAIDLSGYPLPAGTALSAVATAPLEAATTARVAFADVAAEWGIDFVYFNGHDPGAEGARLQETLGGGVAAVDYDGDAWPDLYFTQGCSWPPPAGQTAHLDRMYRNLSARRFVDVTSAAGLGDERFGQGLAAGDFDNDGFPDLFVANIDGNRLYRNNGDGTFDDLTAEAGLTGGGWTTSCLFADLNGDTWPDLYEVHYAEGPDVYDRVCDVGGGRRRACAPVAFRPQPDRCYLSLGDGRFREAPAAAGLAAQHGYGLGAVAADLDGSGRLSLFVANDQDPNLFFENQTPRRGDPPRFAENGLLSGLALGGEGRAQGCMGVAAGDCNGDGRLDLFVTNFYNEPNALYLAEGEGASFVDAIARSGMKGASLPLVGFGTQFVDAELDGLPDLIVANGHVDDFSHSGLAYRMRPQFFRNLGGGRFKELPAEELGPFFAGEYLGRGLARLDFNRDGREEAVISHIGSPAALLVNRTEGAGHFLAVQVRGVDSDRDAIGTTVVVVAEGLEWTAQLTSGDGYMASNQRQLVFGLGTRQRVERLAVRWPSGREQQFVDPPVDATVLIVEGRATLERLPVGR